MLAVLTCIGAATASAAAASVGGPTSSSLGTAADLGNRIALDLEDDKKIVKQEQHIAFEITALLLLIVLSFAVGNWLHSRKITWLPESGATILIGVCFGLMVSYVSPEESKAEKERYFNPDFHNLVLLPPIIFESGYSLNQFLFFKNSLTISTLAVVGTLVTTVFTWLGLVQLGAWGLIPELTVVECGAFACLISAVDPVATLATFGALKVDPNLNSLVFGESVLNDAVAIIFFRSILHYGVLSTFAPTIHLPYIAFSFLLSFFGSMIWGVASGLLAALCFKALQLGRHGDRPALEVALFWVLSYLSYVSAEVPHFSGIVAALFCGVTMRAYVHPNLSPKARAIVGTFASTVATCAETVIFLLVGIALVFYVNSLSSRLTVAVLALCLVGRALNTFPLVAAVNVWRTQKVLLREQAVIWFSGLRGAIAVAL